MVTGAIALCTVYIIIISYYTIYTWEPRPWFYHFSVKQNHHTMISLFVLIFRILQFNDLIGIFGCVCVLWDLGSDSARCHGWHYGSGEEQVRTRREQRLWNRTSSSSSFSFCFFSYSSNFSSSISVPLLSLSLISSPPSLPSPSPSSPSPFSRSSTSYYHLTLHSWQRCWVHYSIPFYSALLHLP